MVEKINLGFVIVTYNSADCIGRLLQSLPTIKNVIVIDNNSTDKTCEIVKSFGCELIANKHNQGYGAGVNQGIKLLYDKCDYFFVLNPDIIIKSLKLDIIDLQKYGIIQPLVLLPNRNVNVEELKMNVLGFVYPLNYNCTPKIKSKKETTFFSGSAFVLNKKTLKKVGYFDESLFLYYEDVDYAIRCNSANEKILFNPNIIVEHDYKNSIGNKNKKKWILKNRKIIANRYFKNIWRKLLFIKKQKQDLHTLTENEKNVFTAYIKPELLLGFHTKQFFKITRLLINVIAIPYSFIIKLFI
ncbi:MAG: glycosyltransferase [Candidatus Peregrinibacteria bacterium GW2011_GWF2_38_29]|nr:MAG: glycosyltransferase [Candidatus Peregrinibacteria bacterium GW2011_GWF2_38_29]